MFEGARRKRLKAVVGSAANARPGSLGAPEARRREAIQAKLKEVERQHASRNKFDLGKALAQSGLPLTREKFMIAAAGSGLVSGLIGLMLSPVAALCAALIG